MPYIKETIPDSAYNSYPKGKLKWYATVKEIY